MDPRRSSSIGSQLCRIKPSGTVGEAGMFQPPMGTIPRTSRARSLEKDSSLPRRVMHSSAFLAIQGNTGGGDSVVTTADYPRASEEIRFLSGEYREPSEAGGNLNQGRAEACYRWLFISGDRYEDAGTRRQRC